MRTHPGSRFVKWLLVILPLWLVVSAVLAMVKYFKDEKKDAARLTNSFSRAISEKDISDDLSKTVNFIGERNLASPAKLAATASMIRGLLGPANTGYDLQIIEGPGAFPLIRADVPSPNPSAPPVWVLTSYDSPSGSPGVEQNATGLVATLAIARVLAGSEPARPIHFLFLPHLNDIDSPVLRTVLTASNLISTAPSPRAILCIEAMGASEALIFTSRDTEAIPAAEIGGLGEVVGAEIVCLGEDSDLASILFEMDHPAIRVATRPILLPGASDQKLPFPPTLAASTGRLLEFINRLSK